MTAPRAPVVLADVWSRPDLTNAFRLMFAGMRTFPEHSEQLLKVLASIPAERGHVATKQMFGGPPLVVLFSHDQDDEKARINEARALTLLVETGALSVLGAEGAWESDMMLSVQKYRDFQDTASVQIVAEHLLRTGGIGPVMYPAYATRAPMRIFGLETKELYEKVLDKKLEGDHIAFWHLIEQRVGTMTEHLLAGLERERAALVGATVTPHNFYAIARQLQERKISHMGIWSLSGGLENWGPPRIEVTTRSKGPGRTNISLRFLDEQHGAKHARQSSGLPSLEDRLRDQRLPNDALAQMNTQSSAARKCLAALNRAGEDQVRVVSIDGYGRYALALGETWPVNIGLAGCWLIQTALAVATRDLVWLVACCGLLCFRPLRVVLPQLMRLPWALDTRSANRAARTIRSSSCGTRIRVWSQADGPEPEQLEAMVESWRDRVSRRYGVAVEPCRIRFLFFQDVGSLRRFHRMAGRPLVPMMMTNGPDGLRVVAKWDPQWWSLAGKDTLAWMLGSYFAGHISRREWATLAIARETYEDASTWVDGSISRRLLLYGRSMRLLRTGEELAVMRGADLFATEDRDERSVRAVILSLQYLGFLRYLRAISQQQLERYLGIHCTPVGFEQCFSMTQNAAMLRWWEHFAAAQLEASLKVADASVEAKTNLVDDRERWFAQVMQELEHPELTLDWKLYRLREIVQSGYSDVLPMLRSYLAVVGENRLKQALDTTIKILETPTVIQQGPDSLGEES